MEREDFKTFIATLGIVLILIVTGWAIFLWYSERNLRYENIKEVKRLCHPYVVHTHTDKFAFCETENGIKTVKRPVEVIK